MLAKMSENSDEVHKVTKSTEENMQKTRVFDYLADICPLRKVNRIIFLVEKIQVSYIKAPSCKFPRMRSRRHSDKTHL